MGKKESLKKQAFQKIFNKIIRNEIPLDQFLTEASLAEELGVSRAPIREALIELCNEDILRNIPRTGYQVIQLTAKDIRDAFVTRAILEVGCAKEALKNITEKEILRLEGIINDAHRIEAKESSPEDWWKINSDFHIALSQGADNQLMTKMIQQTINILMRATTQFFQNRDPSTYLSYHNEGHTIILDAVKEGNEEKLVEVVREDVFSLKRLFQIA